MNSEAKKNRSGWSILFGGVLPIIVFTLIDEYEGAFWGTVVAMLFGCGEMLYEKIKQGKVEKVTLISNLLILILGAVSIATDSGIWFKMQPAIFEAFSALFLWITLFWKKPMLATLAEKQGQAFPEQLHPFLKQLTFRLGIFMAIHAAIATWAAINWTTTQWALLKGVGFTATLIIYLAAEFLILRTKLKKQ